MKSNYQRLGNLVSFIISADLFPADHSFEVNS